MRDTMGMFSLSWNTYKQNIYNGLASLQQNGELVDMTLAADGHHVKVHQLVMSLLSPYIKELISSAQCPHPVIFLNKVSYPVLSSILEYIYTGEVLVSKDHLSDLIVAAKELRIKGLEDMNIDFLSMDLDRQEQLNLNDKTGCLTSTQLPSSGMDQSPIPSPEFVQADDQAPSSENEGPEKVTLDDCLKYKAKRKPPEKEMEVSSLKKLIPIPSDIQVQYSISNQGSLQLILNRYLYYLRYSSRRSDQSGRRLWRCADYANRLRCPATVVTKNAKVIKRRGVHNHSFHDKNIHRKVERQCVFSTLNEAVIAGTKAKEGMEEKVVIL